MLTEIVYLCYIDTGELYSSSSSHELVFVTTSEFRGRAMLIGFVKDFYKNEVGTSSFRAYLASVHVDHPGEDAWGEEIDLTRQIREDMGIAEPRQPSGTWDKIIEADFDEYEKKLKENSWNKELEKWQEIIGRGFVPEKDNKNG